MVTYEAVYSVEYHTSTKGVVTGNKRGWDIVNDFAQHDNPSQQFKCEKEETAVTMAANMIPELESKYSKCDPVMSHLRPVNVELIRINRVVNLSQINDSVFS